MSNPLPQTLTEKPILFSGEMVRAILDGRKTQTRRVMRDVPFDADGPFEAGMAPGSGPFMNQWAMQFSNGAMKRQRCPYGRVGYRLWVRETWYDNISSSREDEDRSHEHLYYRADGEFHDFFEDFSDDGAKWRPSIHMPRWVSRLALEITDVRVQRLQDISPGDAEAEGLENCTDFPGLWDSINAKRGYGWDTNPWVWCVSFKSLPPDGAPGRNS